MPLGEKNLDEGLRRSMSAPELFFGLAAPTGTDLTVVETALQSSLRSVGYKAFRIKLTDQMLGLLPSFLPSEVASIERKGSGFFHDVMYKMDVANELRKILGDGSAMAKLGVKRIRDIRNLETGSNEKTSSASAYIINQLKRPDEVAFFRDLYGDRFFLISIYTDEDLRRERLIDLIRRSLPASTNSHEIVAFAEQLLNRDYEERSIEFGQKLRDTFQFADFFIDGYDKHKIDRSISRFIDLVFGKTSISPTYSEHCMYIAKSASMRSIDMSRQVGAAIFSENGEIISMGCNEVPKAFGGTYWTDDPNDARDVARGFDANQLARNEIIRDVLERLDSRRLLENPHSNADMSLADLATVLTGPPSSEDPLAGILREAQIMDLTEFGRSIHAEMSAICDAARLGRSVKAGRLFCTTFPCHNCAKHIVASGIDEVQYIEPYPKSRAKELHGDAITVGQQVPGKVSFKPFTGVSPNRYRELFGKSRKRKNEGGTAKTWLSDEPKPQIGSGRPTYLEAESFIIFSSERKVEPEI